MLVNVDCFEPQKVLIMFILLNSLGLHNSTRRNDGEHLINITKRSILYLPFNFRNRVYDGRQRFFDISSKRMLNPDPSFFHNKNYIKYPRDQQRFYEPQNLKKNVIPFQSTENSNVQLPTYDQREDARESEPWYNLQQKEEQYTFPSPQGQSNLYARGEIPHRNIYFPPTSSSWTRYPYQQRSLILRQDMTQKEMYPDQPIHVWENNPYQEEPLNIKQDIPHQDIVTREDQNPKTRDGPNFARQRLVKFGDGSKIRALATVADDSLPSSYTYYGNNIMEEKDSDEPNRFVPHHIMPYVQPILFDSNPGISKYFFLFHWSNLIFTCNNRLVLYL